MAATLSASGDVAFGAHQLGFGGDFAIDTRLDPVLPDAANLADDFDVQVQLVTGGYRFLEACMVDADEVENRIVVGLRTHRLERKDSRRLRQRFHDEDPGHDGMMREV